VRKRLKEKEMSCRSLQKSEASPSRIGVKVRKLLKIQASLFCFLVQ